MGRRTCFSFSPRPGARTRPGARSGPPLTEGGPRENQYGAPGPSGRDSTGGEPGGEGSADGSPTPGKGAERTRHARRSHMPPPPPWRRVQRDEGVKPHGLHAWCGALRAAWPSPTEFREGRAPPHLCPEGRGLPSWAIRLAAPVHSRRHRSRAALSRQLGDFQKAAPHTRRVQAVGARRSLQNDARGSAR